MIEEENEYFSVNELTEKLKEDVDIINSKNREYKKEEDLLKKENLEKFLLENTGILVTEGLDVIRELKSVFVGNPNAEEIDALSNAFKAVCSALSVLKDIQVTNNKLDSNKELKEMDIKAKKELAEQRVKSDDDNKIFLTREEIFKHLMERSSEVIDADFSKIEALDTIVD